MDVGCAGHSPSFLVGHLPSAICPNPLGLVSDLGSLSSLQSNEVDRPFSLACHRIHRSVNRGRAWKIGGNGDGMFWDPSDYGQDQLTPIAQWAGEAGLSLARWPNGGILAPA